MHQRVYQSFHCSRNQQLQFSLNKPLIHSIFRLYASASSRKTGCNGCTHTPYGLFALSRERAGLVSEVTDLQFVAVCQTADRWGNSAASATLSPLLDAIQFNWWQECQGLLLKLDVKVNSYHKSVTVEHPLYCVVPVMTIELVKCPLTELNAGLICPPLNCICSSWHCIQTITTQ